MVIMNGFKDRLVVEASEGNFKYIYKTIQSENLNLSQKNALHIIIGCSRVVSDSIKTAITEDYLCKVLLVCNQFIGTLNETQCKQYLQSIYHITKFLLNEGHLTSIIKLESILVPSFISLIKNATLLEIYSNAGYIIAKSIGKLKPNVSEEVLMKICILSLKMLVHCIDFSKLLAIALSYFQKPNFTNADIDLQCQCYLQLWSEVCQNVQFDLNNQGAAYTAIITTLQHMTVNLLQKCEYERARTIFTLGINTVSQTCVQSDYRRLTDIITSTFPLISSTGINSNQYIVTLKMSVQHLRGLSAKKELSPQIKTTCYIITTILQEVLSYFTSLDETLWSCLRFEEIYTQILEMLDLVTVILANTTKSCKCCSSCLVKTNLVMSITANMLIGRFFQLSIHKQTILSYSLFKSIIASVAACCKRIIKMRDLNCQQWISLWKQLRVIIYNSAVYLNEQNSPFCIQYGIVVIRALIELEYNSKLTLEPELLSKALRCISENALKSGDFEKASIFAATEIFYNHNVESASYSQWVQVQYKCKDDLQPLTVVSILTQKIASFKEYFPKSNFELSKERKIKMLLRELAECKQKWPSKTQMGVAITALNEIADTFTVARAVIQTFDADNEYSEDIVRLLPNLIESLSNNNRTVESNICLALLHILQYYVEFQKLKSEAEEYMEIIQQKQPKSPNGSPNSARKTESNLTHLSYFNLNWYCKATSHLTRALNLLTIDISNSAKYINDYKLTHQLETVAYTLERQGDLLLMHQTWYTCFKLSKRCNDNLLLLKSASFILKYSNMDTDITKTILKECNDVVSDLATSRETQALQVLCQYYVNKSLMFLRHGDLDESLSMYQDAHDVFLRISEDARDQLLKLHLEFLNVQHLFLPCSVAAEGHANFSLAKLFELMKNVFDYLNTKGGSKIGSLFLEVNEFIITLYKRMRFTRDMRCHCRQGILYAERHYLPLRIAKILTNFIYGDTIALRFDDVKAGLSSLIDILGLEASHKQPNERNVALKELIGFSKMILKTEANKVGSPNFTGKQIALPQCIFHKKDCTCYYCTSFEYKYLVLVYLTLQALLCVYVNKGDSKEVFEGALQFYSYIINTKKQFEAKLANIFDNYFHFDLQTFLFEPYCSLLLEYGNELLRTEEIEKATTINNDLVHLITKQKRTNAHLYNEALFQSINILLFKHHEKQPQKAVATVSPIKSEVPVDPTFKTPMNNKKIKITLKESYSLKHKDTPERRLCKIKFNLSPAETPVKKASPAKKALPALNTKHKTPLRCNLQLENVQAIVTPAESVGAKPVLKEIENQTDTKTDVIPSSPNAYTPNALKLTSALKARTKLLSKRLQKTNIKIVVSDDEIENIPNSAVCKNLMKELGENEPSKNGDQSTKRTRPVRKTKQNSVPLQTVTRNRNVKR